MKDLLLSKFNNRTRGPRFPGIGGAVGARTEDVAGRMREESTDSEDSENSSEEAL